MTLPEGCARVTGVQRLNGVRERIRRACERAGRDPSSVTLIGVTKGIPSSRIAEAIAAGLTHLGENRVQEARQKQAELSAADARWHLIGHLQRNKAADAVELFGLIHSVDSQALAEALERHAAAAGRRLEILLQVNVSGEATKSGCRPEDAAGLAAAVARCPHLAAAGLMTIAPLAADAEASRPVFRALRHLRDRLGRTDWRLSMGMSQDFEVAIEEGADLIRVGTAIFGDR